jgi:hypothetical protein
MPYAVINERLEQNVAIIFAFGGTILKNHFMLNICRK